MMNTRSDLACKTSKAGVKNSVPPKSISSKHADSPRHSIFFLHRTVGNQAVERLIRSGVIQAKPTIRKPMDEEVVRASDTLGNKPDGKTLIAPELALGVQQKNRPSQHGDVPVAV